MKALFSIFFAIHLLAIAVMVILLLMQGGKAIKVLPKGFIHAGLTALVAGLGMVGIRPALHSQNATQYLTFNYGTIAAKLSVLIIILVIAFKNAKATAISRGTWVALLGLIVVNIGLAGSLK